MFDLQFFNEHLTFEIESIQSVAGGDTSHAFRLNGSDSDLFAKINTSNVAFDMFKAEAAGLESIRKTESFAVPKVLEIIEKDSFSIFLMEWINPGSPGDQFSIQFAQHLVKLHRTENNFFGCPNDNYISILRQKAGRYNRFSEFYYNRILDQINLAQSNNLTDNSFNKMAENLERIFSDNLPDSKPNLIHGDLWSGNYLVGQNESIYLIDPATAFGHREQDLAMMKLFGGFSPRIFEIYNEIFPLDSGFDERIELYQLYYLLVHLNLFGTSYLESCRRILKNWT